MLTAWGPVEPDRGGAVRLPHEPTGQLAWLKLLFGPSRPAVREQPVDRRRAGRPALYLVKSG